MAAHPDRRARFEREAQAVAALQHPHIVTVHSVEEAEGLHFITMELVEGKRLTDLIPAKGLAMGRLLEIAIPLCDAVSAAHQRGIAHRDLKPDNVMIGSDGRVKVLDFGLAKLGDPLGSSANHESTLAAGSGGTVTQDGQLVGTVRYMSPEQAEGRTADARSDVFAIGILLYEMATGTPTAAGSPSTRTAWGRIRCSPSRPRAAVSRR
jgi:non-specific serine/threonine protein kinase